MILATAIIFTVLAIDTYNYEAANDDILVGLGAIMTMIFGGFVVLYELDLFYNVYYFLIKPKTTTKTILNILSNLILVFIFANLYLADVFMELRKYETAPLILFSTYVVLRIVYLAVCYTSSKKEMKE